MKKIIGLLIMMMLFIGINVQAQTPEKVGDDLTFKTIVVDGEKYIAMGDVPKYLLATNKHIGLGKEIGEAFNQALDAVIDKVGKFGDTDIGKWVMALVIWNVAGQDMVRILLGLIFIAIFTWLLVYSFKRTCVDRRVLVKNTNPGFLKYPKVKQYEVVEPLFGDGEGLGIIRIAHIVFFFFGIWITYAIMFT